MSENEFGFPLVYTELSEFYDALNSDDYDKKNHIIETFLKKNNIKSVLDFTCGTGSQAFYLAKYGYLVTGVDINKCLLDYWSAYIEVVYDPKQANYYLSHLEDLKIWYHRYVHCGEKITQYVHVLDNFHRKSYRSHESAGAKHPTNPIGCGF